MDQNIIIKGTPQKNKVSAIMLTASVIAFVCALLFSANAYQNYWIGYKVDFWAYFWGEFFSSNLMYGCILIASVIAFVVSIIMKTNTEKCEITVTNEAISGKLPHGKEVYIPLNQITAVNRSSFNGVSITSIGNVSNFHCIENREEVMKAISYLLANPQQNAQPTQNGSAPVANGSEAEQLKRLKDLLDAGVLTQEEFDAKKKQVLGL
jgi:Ca2+/H+ antiporter